MKPLFGTLWAKVIASMLGGVALVAASCGAWVGWIQSFGNVHVEFRGDVVRSAQVDPAALAGMLKHYGIKTVVNVRGGNPGEAWYDDEVDVAARAGVRYASFGLSAGREPDQRVLADLIETLKAAERPVLIHCNWGADRTGLAAALYGLEVEKLPAEEAARQLSFRYGHFPWLTSRTGAMDRAFWRVAIAKEAP